MKIYISKNGQNLGQFSMDEVNRMLQSGQISQTDMAWQEGMADWAAIASIPGVVVLRPPQLVPMPTPRTISQKGGNPFLWFWFSLQNYANFSGRARRREWWSFWFIHTIPYILFVIPFSLIESLPGSEISDASAILLFLLAVLMVVYWMGMIIPFIAVTARRLHDIGLSSWWLLAVFTPLVGGIFMTVCALISGNANTNRFGAPVEI
jgi:uncharacterized membrane protein YhaH (DUF805 family)